MSHETSTATTPTPESQGMDYEQLSLKEQLLRAQDDLAHWRVPDSLADLNDRYGTLVSQMEVSYQKTADGRRIPHYKEAGTGVFIDPELARSGIRAASPTEWLVRDGVVQLHEGIVLAWEQWEAETKNNPDKDIPYPLTDGELKYLEDFTTHLSEDEKPDAFWHMAMNSRTRLELSNEIQALKAATGTLVAPRPVEVPWEDSTVAGTKTQEQPANDGQQTTSQSEAETSSSQEINDDSEEDEQEADTSSAEPPDDDDHETDTDSDDDNSEVEPAGNATGGTTSADPQDKKPQIDPATLEIIKKVVDLDDKNRPVRPDGTRLTKKERRLVNYNFDKILNGVELNGVKYLGVKQREAEIQRREIQRQYWTIKLGPEGYKNRFGANPNVDPDAYRATFTTTDPNAIIPGKNRPDLAEEVFPENKPYDVDQAFWDKLDSATKQAWNGNILPDAAKKQLQDYLMFKPQGKHQRNVEASNNFAKWYERKIVASAKDLYPKNYRTTPEQKKMIGERTLTIANGQRLLDFRKSEIESERIKATVDLYNRVLNLNGRNKLTPELYMDLSPDELWKFMVQVEPEKYGRKPQAAVHNTPRNGRENGYKPVLLRNVTGTNLNYSGEGDLDIPVKTKLYRRIGRAVMPFRITRR